jgi:ubiquitin carboxyl-terminal hydrolase 48
VHLVHLQDSIILEERVISTAHSNAIFREGLFSVELEVLHQHSILDQTTRLFTQLYLSNKPFIDSKLFVKTLKLDPQAHEDIHEFMKGLLKELSDCLSHSKNSKTRSLVEYLFRGSKSFVHM